MPRENPPETTPSALDRLDPAPAPQPARPTPPEPGFREQGVLYDLAQLPEDLRKGGIAANMIGLAREIDQGFVIGRDTAAHAREIRQSYTALRELAPGKRKGDKTDELAGRRERRLSAAGKNG